MLIVQVCEFGNDGDAEYRMHAPIRQLGKLAGVTTVDCHFSHRHLPELAQLADVLVVQFVNDWELLSLCQQRRASGRITVFEANDNFFDLQPWSPIADAWVDRTVQELYVRWLRMADGIQTSTNELARQWHKRGADEIAVFPNQLAEIDPLPEVPRRPLTVGWGGSPGHFADWYQIAPLLTRWLQAHPNVHLSVMTHELAHSFVQLDPERYHFTRFGSLKDYIRFLQSLDIGLAPLLPTDYNRGRSDVKFLEYASQGVAGIYSNLEPYRESVVHGLTGLLCRSPQEMIEQLELLSSNDELRQQIRQQAYSEVKEYRQLAVNIAQRLDWYRTLMRQPLAPNSSLPAKLREAADLHEDNYWQLRPQAPERVLLDAMKTKDRNQTIAALNEQLTLNPDYVAALVRHGQLCNDLRDHHRALQILERAHVLQPSSPRILSEIGRAWFCLEQIPNARNALEQAIEADANYLPAWQYLLRLLSQRKMPDGAEWAHRAELQFPDCYPLTFLAAAVYPLTERVASWHRTLDRIAATIVPREKLTALRAVRQVLASRDQTMSQLPGLIPLLRRACEVFPESAWLTSELGAELLRAGDSVESFECQSKAFRLRQQANLYQEEFPKQEIAPWSWQFSDHICSYTVDDNDA